MSKIFALKGKGNSGKTETINQVFLILQNKYSTAQATHFKPNLKDVEAIIDIPLNGKIIKVGIESQGDPNSRLNTSLIDFVSSNCDIIICATRSSGMTVNWVNNYSSTHQITVIQQIYTNTNFSAANNSSALNIISMAGL